MAFKRQVYLLDYMGNSMASSAITVASGAEFALTYATFNVNLSPSTNYFLMIQTTESGFYWNEYTGNPLASYNAVNPSSIVPVTNVSIAYAFSIPSTPVVPGTGYSYAGLAMRGYTF